MYSYFFNVICFSILVSSRQKEISFTEPAIKELEITSDYIRIQVEGLAQKFSIRIVEKEEYKTIKFGMENFPMDANMWIQLKQVSQQDTRIKLTIKAEIPMIFKMMFEKKLQQGLDQAVDMLCQIPYNQWI